MQPKWQPTQPVVDRHVLVDHPRGQDRWRQASRTAGHRGEQHRNPTTQLLESSENGQQTVELAHAGGVEPQQRARGAWACGPTQALLDPGGIFLALQQAPEQQQQGQGGEQKPQQAIEQQKHGQVTRWAARATVA